MAIERTFSIIKPDATKRNITGKIIDRFEQAGLRVVASKRLHMTREQADCGSPQIDCWTERTSAGVALTASRCRETQALRLLSRSAPGL